MMKTTLNLAIGLLVATIVYNLIEGGVAIGLGLAADSVSLVGFGLDSLIELSASGIVLGHFLKQPSGANDESLNDEKLADRERFVMRFVGGTFLALCMYIAFESIHDLWFQVAPEKSLIGIILAILSLVIMPVLARKKIQVAQTLGSKALEMEAKETYCCFWLSVILLVGLALNALLGWWWADPLGGLVMIPWLWREGMDALKGEACCGRSCE